MSVLACTTEYHLVSRMACGFHVAHRLCTRRGRFFVDRRGRIAGRHHGARFR